MPRWLLSLQIKRRCPRGLSHNYFLGLERIKEIDWPHNLVVPSAILGFTKRCGSLSSPEPANTQLVWPLNRIRRRRRKREQKEKERPSHCVGAFNSINMMINDAEKGQFWCRSSASVRDEEDEEDEEEEEGRDRQTPMWLSGNPKRTEKLPNVTRGIRLTCDFRLVEEKANPLCKLKVVAGNKL